MTPRSRLSEIPGLQLALDEKAFQLAVLDVCRIYGWTVAHFRPALTKHGWRTPVAADGAGFPDLFLMGHGRSVFRELKTDTGRLSIDQQAWLAGLKANGCDAEVWRPSQWPQIISELGGQMRGEETDS